MSMGTVNGVGAVNSLTTTNLHTGNDGRLLDAAPRKSDATPAGSAPVEVDQVTQQPLPPRFPWLSRLALQLEAAAKQRSMFPSAPVLGDNLDRTA